MTQRTPCPTVAAQSQATPSQLDDLDATLEIFRPREDDITEEVPAIDTTASAAADPPEAGAARSAMPSATMAMPTAQAGDPVTSETVGEKAKRLTGWSRLGLSTQILSSLLVVATCGFLLTGFVNLLIQRAATDERIEAALSQEVAELRTLAQGTDPTTGDPFASADALLKLALHRNIPNPREGLLATVNGTPVHPDSAVANLSPDSVEAILAKMGTTTPHSSADGGSITQGGHELRYVIVPVTVAGSDELGVFAAVIDATAEYDTTDRSIQAHVWASLASLLLIAALGAIAFHVVLRPLRRLSATAEQVGVSELAARVDTDGPKDLARLGQSVNGMLDRLESGFTSQKAMLDDVGHELRTPLTVIRGHLELMDAADPMDVDETRALVTDELDRMARLLNDLVLIARTEAPDFLDLHASDLDQIVTSALHRASSLADRTWTVSAETGIVVHVDEQRITQALLQLASNAVRFTNAGDEIHFGAERTLGDIRIWVRDSGEGIPAGELAGVFNRFERGSSQRNRNGHGSGLGLSIVAAIARAHGGSVSVESIEGQGASFIITLPRTIEIYPEGEL